MPRERETLPVKLFSAKSGFGFLLANDGEDVFLHSELFKKKTGLNRLLVGWEVDCEYDVTPKGRRVRRVFAIFPKEVWVD